MFPPRELNGRNVKYTQSRGLSILKRNAVLMQCYIVNEPEEHYVKMSMVGHDFVPAEEAGLQVQSVWATKQEPV